MDCETDFSAQSLKEQVGARRTTLTTLKVNEVLEVDAKDFPLLYLDGIFTKTFLLWSCCIVERSVINTIKGMPDYGSELLTDHGYMIAASSKKGMVFINKPLGGQSIRGDNFGYDFERIKGKYLSTPGLFFQLFETSFTRFSKLGSDREKDMGFLRESMG